VISRKFATHGKAPSNFLVGVTSWNLTIGWLFSVGLVLYVLSKRLPASFRLATIYFALTVFTNPCYTVGGLNLNEIFGCVAVVAVLARGWLPAYCRWSPASAGLLIVFAVGLVHAAIVSVTYPDLLESSTTLITKFAVSAKILVLAVNLLIVGEQISKNIGVEELIKPCLAAATTALALYIVQIGILASGTAPYGLFLDAGFIGVPSFASVSIERGHFGKFMAPYFPFFLFALVQWKWRLRFALLCLVTLINFSASSQVFFLVFIVMAILKFRRSIGIKSLVVGIFGALCVFVFVVKYWAVFSGIGEKIYSLAIQGDEASQGGRSFSVFYEYISRYPFGIGYGGSSLRTAPDLPEINAPYFVFFSQYSLLGFPILLGYFYLVFRTIKSASYGIQLIRCMSVGVAMSVVIFFTDVLWFVPMIWLPFELIYQIGRPRIVSS